MPVDFDNWDEFEVAITDEVSQRVDRAAAYVESAARSKVSTPGPPRSTPGTPPHTDTTRLYNDIRRDTDFADSRSLVGSSLPYAKFLELGTPRMAARPWLRAALAENQEAVVEIITGKA